MIEILVVLAFSWGGYEYGKASVEPQVGNNAALTTINCPDIMPPGDATFGATTRKYSELITTYRACKASCTTK